LYGLTLLPLKDTRETVGRPIVLSWTTSNLSFNFNDRFGGLAKAIRINNEDPTNTMRYRLNGVLNTVQIDPTARDPIDETWIEQVDVEPNAVTGLGTLQANIVPMYKALLHPNPDMLGMV